MPRKIGEAVKVVLEARQILSDGTARWNTPIALLDRQLESIDRTMANHKTAIGGLVTAKERLEILRKAYELEEGSTPRVPEIE